MKTTLKRILACIVITTILCIGIWGVYTNASNTEPGWQIWGWCLAIATIVWPTVSFWLDKMNWLLDLED
jgi:hypothetical protein